MSKIEFCLESLIESIEKIEIYTSNFCDADDFFYDMKSFDATMMQFIVIGENITKLDDNFKNAHPNIPWQKIKNLRNIVAHNYFGIDAQEVWEIIKDKLLPFKKDIENIKNNL